MRAANDNYHTHGSAYCFDGSKARRGYALNKMCYSFNSADNRKRFRAFPEAYCKRFGLGREQVHAVTDLDFKRLFELGGNPCYLAKLAGIYGMSLEELTLGEEQQSGNFQTRHAVTVRCPYCSQSILQKT